MLKNTILPKSCTGRGSLENTILLKSCTGRGSLDKERKFFGSHTRQGGARKQRLMIKTSDGE